MTRFVMFTYYLHAARKLALKGNEMQSTVPIATDHIYKFYALFGLSLFISAGLTLAYLHVHFVNLLYQESVDLQVLEAKSDLSQEEKIRKDNLVAKIGHDKSLQLMHPKILGNIAGIGLILIVYGFYKWHVKIQPKHDMLVDLQIEKIKFEISTLNR
jgi:hypothetical protein